jgi:hypothetical protein
MEITSENVIKYLAEYQLIENLPGKDEINCQVAAQILYTCFLKRFRWDMDQEESRILAIYQQRVADVLEDLRDRNDSEIVCVLECLDRVNRHLLDVIIMSWCHPRPRQYLSKLMYERCHNQLIEKYHETMIRFSNHYTLRNFRIEAFCRDCYLPVECIDYIWSELVQREIVIVFCNDASGGYIGLINSENTVELSVNMKIVMDLRLGLSKILREGYERSFIDVVKSLLTDPVMIRDALESETVNNYLAQAKYIYDNYSDCLGLVVPPELIDKMK